jgi:FMN-dependent NADH-azoreductase
MVRPIINKGLDYIEDIMKFIGIKNFDKLLVDGTGTTEEDKATAIENAKSKIDGIIEKIDVKEVMLV